MLGFKKPIPEDLDWIREIGYENKLMQNDAGFVNIALLTEKYNTHICNYKDTMLRFFPEGYLKGTYAAPVGKGDYREIIPLLEEDAASRGLKFQIELMTEDDCKRLEEAFPGQFEITEVPDYAEYIHLQERVSLMEGKAYSKKRNHIAQFFRKYPDAKVVPITSDNLKDAYKVARGWLDEQMEERKNYLEYEYRAILNAGSHWDDWGLKGIVVYVGDEPVGMTIASKLSEGVYDVHFEKALADYPHVWSVLVKEFAKYLTDAVWINREEDLGDEGLRKSKLSYRPDLLLQKYRAVRR